MDCEQELVSASDDSLRALNIIMDAWEAGTGDGIAPQLMAYAALYTALSDLVAAYGEEAVASLALGLGPRVRSGEFTLYRDPQ
jgi:thiamine monophosphate kinase